MLNYLLLPFEQAYNWTRILHFLFGGLSMLLLLHHFRFRSSTCVLLALTYEFAGCQLLYFGHPWIQSSFNYYPLLWLAWDIAIQRRSLWHTLAASFLVAGVFYSGNAQSHAYLFFFAVAVAAGYGGLNWSRWKTVLAALSFSLTAGAALATPVLLGEVEMFHLNLRQPSFHSAYPVEWSGAGHTFGGLSMGAGHFPDARPGQAVRRYERRLPRLHRLGGVFAGPARVRDARGEGRTGAGQAEPRCGFSAPTCSSYPRRFKSRCICAARDSACWR